MEFRLTGYYSNSINAQDLPYAGTILKFPDFIIFAYMSKSTKYQEIYKQIESVVCSVKASAAPHGKCVKQ